MEPYFSIIIPLYNKEKAIEKTLKSVFHQSFTDYEILVINDGSTDKSEEKVKRFSDERLRLISSENRGVSQARNLGINESKGKLIAFLDADDYWFPNHLQSLFQLYQNFPEAGLLATNYQFYYSDKKIIQPVFEGIPIEKWSGIVPDFFHSSMKYRIAWTSAVVVPKKVLDDIGNFDENITLGAGEDTDLWIRIALKYPVAFDNEVSANYQMETENRISLSKTVERKFSTLDKFSNEEQSNSSLKKYLDLYRTEFALKHKLVGDIKSFHFYKNAISKENLHWKTQLLFQLPIPILQFLYNLKKKLELFNIQTSAYH
ncbi:glycosyltransferase family 2 protein [Flavobacterium sp.]|uniref:glycosyltransferase family 2 protein n=1 Tax=Flavobacterium sp. TaxID=239 RepID=UPI002FDAD458